MYQRISFSIVSLISHLLFFFPSQNLLSITNNPFYIAFETINTGFTMYITLSVQGLNVRIPFCSL